MKKILGLSIALLLGTGLSYAQEVEIPALVEIPSGTFHMGGRGLGQDWDEAPVHTVTISGDFRIGATPVTNAQFEQYMPSHRDLRGMEFYLSTGDDEAVVYVTWEDAVGYCRWLSGKTGRHFRLPTEAEWEYACRAGTYTLYYTGDGLSPMMERNQQTERNLERVSLEVGLGEPNAFGVYDMHGLVEEWCLDWYGAYRREGVVDPLGPSEGIYKVTRGGSHNTPSSFLRSSSRMGAIPSDSHSQIGFRIVESDLSPANNILGPSEWSFTLSPRYASRVSGRKARWGRFKWRGTITRGGRTRKVKERITTKPFFMDPIPFVVAPSDSTPFYRHNHQPAIAYCDNGDLLAIWFSCDAESGREMVVLGSRLRKGRSKWEKASLFFKVPDRNMTGSSLCHLPDGRILHVNGVSTSGDWQNLAMASRVSSDNGATWSAPVLSEKDHARRHQVIQGPIVLRDGTILQCCDAGPGGNDGTSVHLSSDNGATFFDPWDGEPLPLVEGGVQIEDGSHGSTIAGIHAGVVELSDGSLLALGRGNPILSKEDAGRARMPLSISHDRGRTWEYHASPFPPIDGGQRLVLLRLREGPLMLVSFTDHPLRTPPLERGMDFRTGSGGTVRGYGAFVALSYDEGRTWPVSRLLGDGQERFLDGGAWTGFFTMDATHSEPRGYLAGVQTPDGTIHILSSRLHYRFNKAWIEEVSK